MEKRDGKGSKKPVQGTLQIRDQEVNQEEKVVSDDLQSNRQLQINVLTQNDLDLLQAVEENDKLCVVEEGLKQETDVHVKQKIERSLDKFLVGTQDSTQTIQLGADAVHQYDDLAENAALESEKSMSAQQRVENIDKILVSPAQDSISTARHGSGDADQQEWDRNAKIEQFDANTALQQKSELPRIFSILSSKIESLEQQPCELKEQSATIKREQDITPLPQSAAPDKILETPKETQAIQNEKLDQKIVQREQELKKMLADYFSKQNRFMTQQGTESPIEILLSPVQDSVPRAEHESIGMAQHEWGKIGKSPQLKTNAASQRSDQPRKLFILNSTKECLQQTSETSEDVKVREQDIVAQQESTQSDKASETQTEGETTQYDGQDPESIDRKQELTKMFAEYSSKQNRDLDNSERTELQKRKEETVTYGESEDNWNGYPQELGGNFYKCLPEPEDSLRGKSQETKEDSTMGRNLETREFKGQKNGVVVPVSAYKVKPVHSQSSKDYVTFHRRESDDRAAGLRKLHDCLHVPQRSDEATVRPQKSKEYVTFHGDPTVTARSPKAKDYVTLRPRKPDNETLHTKISTSIPRESKGYVTSSTIQQNVPAPITAPPTHVFWPVRRIGEYASNPDPSIPIDEFIRSLLEESSSPDPRMPLGTQQLTEERNEILPPLSRRTYCRQLPIPQRERCPISEDDSFPIVPLEEVSPESEVETNQPEVQRNRRILRALVPPLSTGLQGSVQRFCERHVPAERQASFKKLITGCMLLFYSLLVGGIVTAALYFGITFLIRIFDVSDSSVTHSVYNSHFNLNVLITDAKHHRRRETLHRELNIPRTHLGISEINSNVDFTTLVSDFDVSTTNSLVDLDSETIPVMNGLKNRMNTPETYTESNMATLVTNLDVNLIHFDFGVTTPLNDFDLNHITSLTDLDINAKTLATDLNDTIIPVTDLNINFTTCETLTLSPLH